MFSFDYDFIKFTVTIIVVDTRSVVIFVPSSFSWMRLRFTV
jgi:hypothetical protein